MKKKLVWRLAALALFAAALIHLAGCGTGKTVQAKDLMAGVEARGVEALTDLSEGGEKTADFAWKLFAALHKDGKNTLVSPLSVLAALAMTANGARGETKAQMENCLGMKAEDLNRYLYSLTQSLSSEEKASLSLANSVWFTDDELFSVGGEFLQTVADYYGASAYKTHFDEAAKDDINAWVKNKTNGMIPEILDQIPEQAVMYLVNALAFEAKWRAPYTKDQVRDAVFTGEDGKKTDVQMMYDTVYDYLETENASGFLRFYQGKYAFGALLPNEGVSVSEVIRSLDGEKLHALLSAPQHKEVRTGLLKFETKDDAELSKTLISIGMERPFESVLADFSALGSYEGKNIYIGRVLHKTFISVTEEGTRAGAATAVEMMAKNAMPIEEPKEVILDRPFVYFLFDTETNTPFMIGTLLQP